MYAFNEIRWIVQECLRRVGLLCENGNLPCISSIEIDTEEDEHEEGKPHKYIFCVEATSNVVLNGLVLPAQVGLSAVVTELQQHLDGTITDVYPGADSANKQIMLSFTPNTWDIETGTAEIIAPSK